MLKNPCYAGAFAYGKTAPRTVIKEERARQRSRHKKPQNEWNVLLVDHHPGYISWKEYLENQDRLEANVAWGDGEGSGAAKVGALCYPDCCVAGVAEESCRWLTAARAAVYRDTSVREIEATAARAGV
jgi:hypothetical protein